MSLKRGYYRIPRKAPANRIEGALAEAVLAKFAEGWPKARIAREFRLNRRTVTRICATNTQNGLTTVPQLTLSPLVRCIGCGREIRQSLLPVHLPYCLPVRRRH
jgi:hypothetical protein